MMKIVKTLLLVFLFIFVIANSACSSNLSINNDNSDRLLTNERVEIYECRSVQVRIKYLGKLTEDEIKKIEIKYNDELINLSYDSYKYDNDAFTIISYILEPKQTGKGRIIFKYNKDKTVYKYIIKDYNFKKEYNEEEYPYLKLLIDSIEYTSSVNVDSFTQVEEGIYYYTKNTSSSFETRDIITMPMFFPKTYYLNEGPHNVNVHYYVDNCYELKVTQNNNSSNKLDSMFVVIKKGENISNAESKELLKIVDRYGDDITVIHNDSLTIRSFYIEMYGDKYTCAVMEDDNYLYFVYYKYMNNFKIINTK